MFFWNKEKLKICITMKNFKRVCSNKGNWKIDPAAKMQSNLQILVLKMQCCFVLGIRQNCQIWSWIKIMKGDKAFALKIQFNHIFNAGSVW